MKRLVFLLSAAIFGCNNDVLTDPLPDETTRSDFNLLLEAPPYFIWDSKAAFYTGQVTVYLRPFEHVKPTDQVVIEFNSNPMGRFIVPNDTLYTGDKIRIKYADFKDFFLFFTYQSQQDGSHRVELKTTIRTVSKNASVSFSPTQIQ